VSTLECHGLNVHSVPSGVLSVLPGPGATTGKQLVSHPLVRKVDITVNDLLSNIWYLFNRIHRRVQLQDVLWGALLVEIWQPLLQNSVGRYAIDDL
jgi:Aldehyde dehydrogenase family